MPIIGPLNNPRLLLTTPDFPPAVGGIQHLLGEMVRRLAAWEVCVLTGGRSGSEGSDPELGGHVAIRRVRATSKWPVNVELNARAPAVALRFRPHVVLSGHVAVGPGAIAAARVSGAPLVTYVYADEVPHREWLSRMSLQRSQTVVAISRYAADLAVSAGAERRRIVLVPPGAGPIAPVETEPPAAGPSIVTVARLVDVYKGHDLMLEVVVLLKRRHPGITWHVVGDGPLRPRLEARARQLGVSDNVVFHGRLADRERDAVVAASDAFVMPSRLPPSGAGGEGFGIVYLEAGLLGVPSVGGKVAGVPDAIVDGETGFLVDPQDVQAIARALDEFIGDREKRDRMGEAARARAAGEFSWDSVAKRLDEALRGALSGQPARAQN